MVRKWPMISSAVYRFRAIPPSFRQPEILTPDLTWFKGGRSITEQTYYRWKKEYGGLRVDQAKRLKSLEQENSRLKRIVADLSLDNSILKEVASGNF
jgi:hypothetical protein